MPPLPSPKDKMLNGVLVAVGTVLVLYLAILSIKALAEYGRVGLEPRPRDTFTIEGEGRISAEPTLAEVDLGLYSEGRDVASVQQANAATVNAIIAALKQLGIADADFQTANYHISPKFEYRDGVQNVVGYIVSQNLKVKVRNLSNVGAVLARAGELGANQVNGVRFTIDDPTHVRQLARAKAIEDAKKKARELADAMGVRVVKVVTFSESSGATEPPMFAFRALDAAPVPAAIPEIQSGELDVQSRVSVTFEIR